LSPKVKTLRSSLLIIDLRTKPVERGKSVTATPANPWAEMTQPSETSTTGVESHPSGWWKAVDGNWYPPETNLQPTKARYE
jgi:hypothetical protein